MTVDLTGPIEGDVAQWLLTVEGVGTDGISPQLNAIQPA